MSASSVRSNFVEAAGLRTHYLECGAADAPPLLLVHGGGAGANSRGNWLKTLPAFARERRVFAMDMVGFGETAKPDPESFEYSQASRNAHLIGFIEALGLGPLPIVGNSMGGATAMGVAMKRPDLVSTLVLMGSAGLNVEITPALAPILRYDFTLEGMRRLVNGLTGSRFEATDEMVRTRYEESILPAHRSAYESTMAWIGRQGGLFYREDEIAKIKTEALVVNGKEDKVVPLSCAYRFLDLLENSRGYIVPHCGHWVMMEAPDEFATIVLHYLRGTGRMS